MTVNEALGQSIAILNGINIPVSMIQQVGTPVSQAVMLIQACVNALQKNAEETKETAATDRPDGAEPKTEEGREETQETEAQNGRGNE